MFSSYRENAEFLPAFRVEELSVRTPTDGFSSWLLKDASESSNLDHVNRAHETYAVVGVREVARGIRTSALVQREEVASASNLKFCSACVKESAPLVSASRLRSGALGFLPRPLHLRRSGR